MRRRALEYFSHKPRRVVIAAWMTLVPTGVGLFAFGVVGDNNGWWSAQPYMTNMLTAFTSAAFGIPFALSFLSWFSRAQAISVDWLSVRKNATFLISSLERSLDSMVKGSLEIGLQNLKEIRRYAKLAWELLVALDGASTSATLWNMTPRGYPVLYFQEFRASHASEIARLTKEIDLICSLARAVIVDRAALEVAEAKYRQDWQTYQTVVSARISEREPGWLSSETYAVLQRGGYDFVSSTRIVEDLTKITDMLNSEDKQEMTAPLMDEIFRGSEASTLSPWKVQSSIEKFFHLRMAVKELGRSVAALS